MKKSPKFPVHQIIIFALFIVFVCGLNIPGQTISSITKITTATVKNTDSSGSRQRIVKVRGIKSLTTFDLEKIAFDLLNEKRAENDLGALEWSDEVARIARGHSQNMASNNFFSHRGIDGSMIDDRAFNSGLRNWQAIGENIAFNCGYENPVEFAVERWMMSPSHRENLLSSRWRESAVGVAIGSDGSYYFTQVFLLRK